MATNYDPIAEQYKRSKQTPWRTHIECHTLLATLGGVDGKAVLDVACGEGFYTRLLRHRGAARVTGVDLSEGMVALARRQEAESPLGIEYLVGDGRDLRLPQPYDLAVAAYLLNYAPTRQELAAMCNSIGRTLKPGGRFVTVNCNPALDFRVAPSYRAYGFETRFEGDQLAEGTPITWTFYLDDGPFSIENYYLPVSVHEEALRAAGFRTIRWHAPRLSPQGEAEHSRAFWEPFLKTPPVTFLECVK
jgi:ubiquinone/menaquinone biosynthesis C-methylase UbiE